MNAASEYEGFHAMAVAALTGHGDPDVISQLPATVPGSRIALAALHSWTEDDFPNAAARGIQSFSPSSLRADSSALLAWLHQTGCSRVAIHFDVDTIDSNETVYGLRAEPDGLRSAEVQRIMNDIGKPADVVGLTIAELIPRQAIQLGHLLSTMPLVAPGHTAHPSRTDPRPAEEILL